jgi:hypothetical protein
LLPALTCAATAATQIHTGELATAGVSRGAARWRAQPVAADRSGTAPAPAFDIRTLNPKVAGSIPAQTKSEGAISAARNPQVARS